MADPKPPRTGVDTVVERILDTEKQTRLLSGASGTQRNRVLADLAGRLSYFARDEDAFFQVNRNDGADSPTAQFDVPVGDTPLEFHLRERRLVRLVGTINLSATFTASDVNRSGTAWLVSTLIVDGAFSVYADETDAVQANVSAGSPATRTDIDKKRARVEVYADLQPGTHTVQVGLLYAQLTPGGSGLWSGQLIADTPVLAVDVLQTLD